jgi:hypothetical protein
MSMHGPWPLDQSRHHRETARGTIEVDTQPGIYAASREDGLMSIEGIVDAFAFLYGQPQRAWSFEVDVRTSKKKW